jgi:CubicO group peptidase (beta-lactamase class C family)
MCKLIFSIAGILSQLNVWSQSMYFPPNSGNNWATTTVTSLNWCQEPVNPLYQYLENNNTKGFIVLHGGKILLEKYFGTFSADSLWYWASSGKSLTALLVGIAQSEGRLSIEDSTSKYLGMGWTATLPEQERAIKIRHQLSMNTGLDDRISDKNCTNDTCLKFLADTNTRWAYYNAPYTLLENVVTSATGVGYNIYTQQKIGSRIGMGGFWFKQNDLNVYYSNLRSMARFGLLIQNKAKWNGETILTDTDYFNSMVNTSQQINLSYGYLWWLNGKSSFMIPDLQFTFQGSWSKSAPSDMIAALGKNGQIISISGDKNIVWVRMGNAPNEPDAAISLSLVDTVWRYINQIMCSPTGNASKPYKPLSSNQLYPNPTSHFFYIPDGYIVQHIFNYTSNVDYITSCTISKDACDVAMLPAGYYYIVFTNQDGEQSREKLLITR